MDSTPNKTESPVGSFFANARKKMERVAENLDAKASRLLTPKSKEQRSVIPPEVYSAFQKKLGHPANALIYEAMRVFVATFAGSGKLLHVLGKACFRFIDTSTPEPVANYPNTIKSFCTSLRKRMYELELWQPFAKVPVPPGLSDALSECIERWVTMELYGILFAADEEAIARDKALFDKLASLAFITQATLDIPKK
jgi:hypothetical protein